MKENIGFSGGLLLGWNNNVSLDILYVSESCMIPKVENLESGDSFNLFCSIGSRRNGAGCKILSS